ncbi:MAG: 4Fe-4S binding protein [Deltaproteobacteria bacterium]|nr:4Fe-4S binding protein [Deltaproteobacteria bacterium]
MPSIKTFQWKRRMTQIAFLIFLGEFSFYGIFRCPFAVPYVSCGNCPVIQCPGRKLWLGFWIVLPVSAIIFGRFFCGWACPGGFVSELLGKLSLARGKMKGALEKVVSSVKYLVIAGSLVVFLLTNNPRWATPIRIGDFFNSVKLTFEHADNLWVARTFFVLIGLGLAILIPGFWCRYLCPTGGILEAFRRFSLFKYFKTKVCDDCDKCRELCDLETRPSEINCTNCGACSNICPVDAIKVGWKAKGKMDDRYRR